MDTMCLSDLPTMRVEYMRASGCSDKEIALALADDYNEQLARHPFIFMGYERIDKAEVLAQFNEREAQQEATPQKDDTDSKVTL